MEKNSYVYIKETTKNGKNYHNLVVVTELENGKKVDYQVKLAFYNKKFAYLLSQSLPRGSKNGK